MLGKNNLTEQFLDSSQLQRTSQGDAFQPDLAAASEAEKKKSLLYCTRISNNSGEI